MALDLSSLRLRLYPDPVLRRRARQVESVDEDVRAAARRMIEIMQEQEGIGLAANQVGLEWRLFVAHVPHSDDEKDDRSLDTDPVSATEAPTVYINPVLSDPERELVAREEGCLSLPEIRGEVRRPSRITITALDLEGREFTRRAGGLLARCWQHEVDHLDGVLIIDRMVQIDRMKNRSAIRSMEDRKQQERPL